ncbi:MAG: diaminobutyrate acetyltransferase [Syntrophaceae bacterium]|nr:diaminobutyrate acetyltransferase [Syntrophaceae bacterium]
MINYSHQIIFRLPEKKDARSVMKLIEDLPPLDVNSLYCYLLICTRFAQTSVIADHGHEPCGFISAYIHPERKDTIFVWQIIVKNNVRGQGIASAMPNAILHRAYPVPLRYLETTVNPSNKSSNALFSALSKSLNAHLLKSLLFSENDFGGEKHEKEIPYRTEPFSVLTKEGI